MADRTQTTVTRLIAQLQEGRADAVDRLFELVYQALRELAHRQRRRWRDDHTLNTTALLHEAYIKLVDQDALAIDGRAHFFALASRAMRHILCNYARDRRALKRGGGADHIGLEEDLLGDRDANAHRADVLVDLDDALRRLEQVGTRAARVVECRFFGGMTVEETAAALEVSPRTVKRDWAVAQAWLHRELKADA